MTSIRNRRIPKQRRDDISERLASQHELIKQCDLGCVVSLAEFVERNADSPGFINDIFKKIIKRWDDESAEMDIMRFIGNNDEGVDLKIWKKLVIALAKAGGHIIYIFEGAAAFENITEMKFIVRNLKSKIAGLAGPNDSFLTWVMNGGFVALPAMKIVHTAKLLEPNWEDEYIEYLENYEYNNLACYYEPTYDGQTEKRLNAIRSAWVWVHEVAKLSCPTLLEDEYFEEYLEYIKDNEFIEYTDYINNRPSMESGNNQ